MKNRSAWLHALAAVALVGLLTACPSPGGGGGGGGGGGTKSSDAALSGLSLTTGSLAPIFSANTYTYTAGVPQSQATVSVIASTHHNKATLTIDGNGATSGTPSGSVALTEGADRVINVVVTAENGTTTKTYKITVRRASQSERQITGFAFLASDNSPILNADCQGTINEGAKTITFNIKKTVLFSLYNLKPKVAFIGSSVTPASGEAVTFTDGVAQTYTVFAADGSSTDYSVTINLIALGTLKGTVTLPAPDASAALKPTSVDLRSSNQTCGVGLQWLDDQNATYIFDGILEAGTYTLTIKIDMDGSGGASNGDYYKEISNIVVGSSGTVTQNVSLDKLASLPSVSGTISVSSGSPAGKDLQVELIDQTGVTRNHVTVPWASGTTQSYTIDGVLPGTYYVMAAVDMDASATLTAGDYLAYYGGSSIFPPASANVTVTSSGKTGVSFTLPAVPAQTASVSGTVTLPAGNADGKFWAVLVNTSPSPHDYSPFFKMSDYAAWSGTGTTATYTVSNLFPGTYYVGVFVDMDGDDQIDSGDYFAFYGGSGVNPPASANVTLTVGQSRTGINITAGTIP